MFELPELTDAGLTVNNRVAILTFDRHDCATNDRHQARR